MINIHAKGEISSISRKLLEIQLHREIYNFDFPATKCQYIKNFKRGKFAVRAGWMARPTPPYPLTVSVLYKTINYQEHGNIFLQFYSPYICYIDSTFKINI